MRFYGKSSKEKLAEARKKIRSQRLKIHNREFVAQRRDYERDQANKQVTKIKREAKSKIRWMESTISHLVKDESWNKSTSKQVHLEIIVRAIISYRKLEQSGIVAFSELAFLITGSQFEYFSRKEVELRTGFIHYFKRDLKACIEAGFINKIERKPLYYLTLSGKERLDAILGHIYREKGMGTKVFKGNK